MTNDIIVLPLSKGQTKNPDTADYRDALPVNMLTVLNPVLNAAGYMRSFPGLSGLTPAPGLSRGADYHTRYNHVFRVLGESLCVATLNMGISLPGEGRVSMAHSRTSQGIAAEGKLFLWNISEKKLKTLENWTAEEMTDTPIDRQTQPPPEYEIGAVRDICHNRGRYIWVKDGTDTFGITDLEDESHPDRYRPFYRAESMPDGIQGVESWRDMVVAFGTTCIEYFSLTGMTGMNDSVYIAQPSLMINMGIAGTHCKCHYRDSFAIISHHAHGSPSVWVIDNGSRQCIATREIEKILAEYTAHELEKAVMESVRFEGHELLIIHLPREVLCFDATAQAGHAQWHLLTTGAESAPWRAIDLVWDGNAITVGDKREPVMGHLDFSCFSQYGQAQACLLTTPIIEAKNALLFDLEIETHSGQALTAEQCFISATTDGVHFGKEHLVPSGARYRYDQRILLQRVGRCRKNIGFRFRFITSTPFTLAQCRIRRQT